MGHFRRRLSFVWICCLACIIRIIVGQQCDEETIELQHNLFWSLKKTWGKEGWKSFASTASKLIFDNFTLYSNFALNVARNGRLIPAARDSGCVKLYVYLLNMAACIITILCTIPIPIYTIPIGCNPIRFVLNIAAGVHIHCTICYSNLKRNDKNKSSKKIWWVRMAKFFKENSRKPKIYRRLSGACTSLVSRQMLPMLRILAGFED